MTQRLKTLIRPLVYCLLASTTLRLLKGVGCLAVALCVVLLGPREAQRAGARPIRGGELWR